MTVSWYLINSCSSHKQYKWGQTAVHQALANGYTNMLVQAEADVEVQEKVHVVIAIVTVEDSELIAVSSNHIHVVGYVKEFSVALDSKYHVSLCGWSKKFTAHTIATQLYDNWLRDV